MIFNHIDLRKRDSALKEDLYALGLNIKKEFLREFVEDIRKNLKEDMKKEVEEQGFEITDIFVSSKFSKIKQIKAKYFQDTYMTGFNLIDIFIFQKYAKEYQSRNSEKFKNIILTDSDIAKMPKAFVLALKDLFLSGYFQRDSFVFKDKSRLINFYIKNSRDNYFLLFVSDYLSYSDDLFNKFFKKTSPRHVRLRNETKNLIRIFNYTKEYNIVENYLPLEERVRLYKVFYSEIKNEIQSFIGFNHILKQIPTYDIDSELAKKAEIAKNKEDMEEYFRLIRKIMLKDIKDFFYSFVIFFEKNVINTKDSEEEIKKQLFK